MARYHGKNGSAVVGSTGAIAEINDWSLDSSRSMADASAMGEDDSRALPGQKTKSGSITCNFDQSDADGQEALETAHESGVTVTLTLYERTPATGVKYWTGDVWIEKVGRKVPVGGKVERTFGFRSEGAMSRATVA